MSVFSQMLEECDNEIWHLRKALRLASEDLSKAANQFAALAHETNAGRFSEKADRAALAAEPRRSWATEEDE